MAPVAPNEDPAPVPLHNNGTGDTECHQSGNKSTASSSSTDGYHSNNHRYVSMEIIDKNDHDDGSVVSADGIYDRAGFACICLVTLLSTLPNGLLMPFIWPMLSSLEGDGVSLGYSVAAFSFGRLVGTVGFGFRSDQIGFSKPLLVSTCCVLVGSILYGLAAFIVGSVPLIVIALFILGVGTGTFAIAHAFVAHTTAQQNRIRYMAWLAAVYCIGTVGSPLLGTFINNNNKDTETVSSIPVILLCCTAGGSLFTLIHFFPGRDQQSRLLNTSNNATTGNPQETALPTNANNHGTGSNRSNRSPEIEGLATRTVWTNSFCRASCLGQLDVYQCAIFGCILAHWTIAGSKTMYRSILIIMTNYIGEQTTATILCQGLAVIPLVTLGYAHKMVDVSDVNLLLGSMGAVLLGFLLLTTLASDSQLGAYLGTFVLETIGYPIGQVAILGLFSKVVGRRPQGAMFAWLVIVTALLSMISNIVMSYVMWAFFGSSWAKVPLLFTPIVLVIAGFLYWGETVTLLSK